MAMLSKVSKPDNFESQNSALKKLLVFIHVLLDMSLLLNQTILIFWFYVRQNLEDSIHLSSFSVRGYLSLIRKYSHAICIKN